MPTFDPRAYGPLFADLLTVDRCRPLGPGQPNGAVRDTLRSLTPEAAMAPAPVADRPMAELCCAAIWLLHDYLDESHSLSQAVDTPSGSYWHGIMHRREGDFSNAKYWFRRVGEHPVFEPLAAAAALLVRDEAPDAEVVRAAERSPRERPARPSGIDTTSTWDPFHFIDQCEAAERGRSDSAMLCRKIQQLEWELLFDYCYQQAHG